MTRFYSHRQLGLGYPEQKFVEHVMKTRLNVAPTSYTYSNTVIKHHG